MVGAGKQVPTPSVWAEHGDFLPKGRGSLYSGDTNKHYLHQGVKVNIDLEQLCGETLHILCGNGTWPLWPSSQKCTTLIHEEPIRQISTDGLFDQFSLR
jgi:hypothetical protein